MTRDRAVALFIALVAVTIAVIVLWLAFFRHEQHTVVVPIESTPQTPLPRDSIREPKRRKVQRVRGQSPKPSSRLQGASPSGVSTDRGKSDTQKRRSASKPPRTTATKPKPQNAPQASNAPTQPQPQPSPQPEPKPTVTVTVPPVCVGPVRVGDC